MALPSWWQVSTPHKDIREERLNEAIFAANLWDVVEAKAPVEYNDPSMFLQRTYLTGGLKKLLQNVLGKLEGGKGDPVIQLQTPFGGGKTHALLTLFHLVKNRKAIDHVPEISKLPRPTSARVAVFVGTHADAVSGKTPWGEIADQLDQYEIVKKHDEKRIAPGKERLREVMEASGPTLILIDEILEYIVRANRAEKVEKITQGQTLAFLQEISEVIAATDNCCLVLTLPSSILERYDEEAEKSLRQLQKVVGRVEKIYAPVKGVELYEIVRKRLFEDLGDQKKIKRVAQSYFDLYQKLGVDVPPEFKEIQYREQIEKAYPFHPELIDVLYEQWGSYPNFQRTRGVLRLLAEVVADTYKRKVASPLIQSSLVDLDNDAIRREFIKHIGDAYETVIGSDIAGKSPKAAQIDKEMGSEYEKYGIASGIATSVFLYSFISGQRKGTTLPRIRVALLREGIPSTIVGDAISKLEERLFYFHSDKKEFAFRIEPNLNRVIVDKEEKFTEEKIMETLRKTLEANIGRALEGYLWPVDTSDIPDSKSLKLAVLTPEHSYGSDKGEALSDKLFERAGVGFRVYKNTLFLLAIDNSQFEDLSNAMRRYLALSDIQNDKAMARTLTKESQDELKKKVKESEKDMPFRILNCHRYLAMQGVDGLEWKDLGIPTIGTDETLSGRVKRYLEDQEKLLRKVTPKYILDRAFGKEDDEKSLREVYDLMLKTPGISLPVNEEVLLDAVSSGVLSGIVGVREGEEVYYLQMVSPTIDSVVLRGEVAKALVVKEAAKSETEKSRETFEQVEEHEEEGLVRKVSLRASVPWDRLSDVIKGVLSPLKDKGLPPQITIDIKAESEEGFDRTTLDSRVKETLKQIDAEIIEWKED